MQKSKKLKKQLQRGVALTSVATFLLMPVNVAYGANNITAGASGVGSLTNITGGTGNVTDVTSNFVKNGTGINHFGNFNIGAGGTANLLGANRYVNLVDTKVNINGILNSFKTGGQLPANVMFISSEGMAVGAGGVLNVAGLQMITPTQTDYKSLIEKAGAVGTAAENIVLSEADFANLKAGGNALVEIGGKIYSAGDVVIQAGNGIYFQDGGIISTTAGAETLGDISLFTNTGDILDLGSNAQLRLDSAGNISLSAKDGGIGEMMLYNQELNYGEATTVLPLNVKVAEGKKLNVEVSETSASKGSYKGFASVANSTTNLNVGTVKGANVKIENKGHGTLTTTEAITNVDKIYLNAENGYLNVAENITAKEIVRLNGKVGIESAGNLTVTDNGYISVHSAEGDIDMNDATLKSGNIDIKAGSGDVTFGNVTIQERGAAEGTLRLVDNKKLSTGIKAPDTFRFDGVHISADNDIVQKENTKISSAGRVDLSAAGAIDATVEAVDLISSTGGKTNLKTLGTARLGDISSTKLTVNGENILVDGKVNSTSTMDITATDKVTIRPNTALDADHRTYGVLEAKGDVSINAENGILATEQRPEGAMITSTAGAIKLNTKGDIKANGSNNKITVSSNGFFDANGNDVNLHSVDSFAKVGLINAANDANISGDGNIAVDYIEAGNDLVVEAKGSIYKDSAVVGGYNNIQFKSGNDMILKSEEGSIGHPLYIGGVDEYNSYSPVNVEVGGLLEAEAAGYVFINGEDLNIASVKAGQDVNLAANSITAVNATAGNNMTLNAANGVVVTNAKVGGELNAKATAEKANVNIGTVGNVAVGTIEAANDVVIAQGGDLTINDIVKAGNDVKITGDGAILQAANKESKPAISAGNDITLKSNKKDVGASDNYLSVDLEGLLEASAPQGGVYIEGLGDLNIAKVESGKDAAIKANSITAVDAITGNNLTLDAKTDIAVTAANVGGKLDATAAEGSIDITAPQNITIGKVNAAKDAKIKANGYIHQVKNANKPAITTGNNLTLLSKNDNVGDPNNYLSVKVGGQLDAAAPNGGVYIEGLGDLKIDKVEAGKDVGLKAENNLHQVAQANPEDPRIISGGNMKLESANANVGDPNNYLQVKVGKQLDATAPKGGVYIGSKDNITIGQVSAGKDVGIESDGFIHQTDNGKRPAIISGGNMHLVSNNDNVGDPNNYLTVKVGDKLDASAPQGGVYIYGYGDLTVDKVEAGKDVYIGGNEDIIIPHNRPEGNIIAGENVKIEAGDSVLNGGGENPGIISGGDIEVIANLNQKEPAGSIGELPYNDLSHSINVVVKGEVKADEVGVPTADKILNIHIMGQDSPMADGTNTDTDTFNMDDRDQRNMKFLADDDNNDASVRNNRQHLRYNVANSEYVLLDSATESGVKVQDVLNISKQGMLVQTDGNAQVGENIAITMDYKGLPFTVEGTVVRTDAAKGTAGIQFNNIDQFTSSMILYLGMMNGMK